MPQLGTLIGFTRRWQGLAILALSLVVGMCGVYLTPRIMRHPQELATTTATAVSSDGSPGSFLSSQCGSEQDQACAQANTNLNELCKSLHYDNGVLLGLGSGVKIGDANATDEQVFALSSLCFSANMMINTDFVFQTPAEFTSLGGNNQTISNNVNDYTNYFTGLAVAIFFVFVLYQGYLILFSPMFHTTDKNNFSAFGPRILFVFCALLSFRFFVEILINVNNSFINTLFQFMVKPADVINMLSWLYSVLYYNNASTGNIQSGYLGEFSTITSVILLLLVGQLLLRIIYINVMVILGPFFLLTFMIPDLQQIARWWMRSLVVSILQQSLQIFIVLFSVNIFVSDIAKVYFHSPAQDWANGNYAAAIQDVLNIITGNRFSLDTIGLVFVVFAATIFLAFQTPSFLQQLGGNPDTIQNVMSLAFYSRALKPQVAPTEAHQIAGVATDIGMGLSFVAPEVGVPLAIAGMVGSAATMPSGGDPSSAFSGLGNVGMALGMANRMNSTENAPPTNNAASANIFENVVDSDATILE